MIEHHNGVMYMFGNVLGKGTFGTVYKAIASKDGKVEDVAIKIMQTRDKKKIVDEIMYLEIFNKNKVICEKYVACLRDVYFRNNGEARIVYDYVDGVSMETMIDNNISLENPDLAVHLITGLNYFFRLGVYHLDIKPANIMFDRNSHYAKYVDWGSPCFNRAITSIFTGTLVDPRTYWENLERIRNFGSFKDNYSLMAGENNCLYLGTTYYAPPELVELTGNLMAYITNPYFDKFHLIKNFISEYVTAFENNIGKMHDIWSLGVTLYLCYLDLNEFEDYEFNTITSQEEINRIIDKKIKIPLVATVIKLMLTIDPKTRLANWNTIVNLIDEYCIVNEDSTKMCPTKSDTESVNKFIRNVHYSASKRWHDANIDPLVAYPPNSDFDTIQLKNYI